MCKSVTEYRINKKGAECFRTRDYEACKAKLRELDARRPGIYTMQSRSCSIDRYGVMESRYDGKPNWTIWR